jgi:hypothetical protein
VGQHHPERFTLRAQRIGRPYTRLLIGEVPVQLRVSPHVSGLAEQQRHLSCKQAQTGAAPVAGWILTKTKEVNPWSQVTSKSEIFPLKTKILPDHPGLDATATARWHLRL